VVEYVNKGWPTHYRQKGRQMKRQFLIILLIMTTVLIPGCTLITGENDEIIIDTDLERMLGYVPYSSLEESEVWFINFGKAKGMYGVEDIKSIEEAKQLPDDRMEAIRNALTETGGIIPIWRSKELSPVIGFDGLTLDRIIHIGVIPPKESSIVEGNFEEELITDLLTGQGYTKTDYGSYSYYGIRGDYAIDVTHPIARMVLATMNRLAVLDDMIIVSPATEYVTGVFDAMAGDTPSITDNTACRALADSLGDVLMAVVTTPARVVFTFPGMEEQLKFDFTIPNNWGLLHQYDMAALGYKADGEKRFLVIALYYADEEEARANGAEIVKRMGDYILGTYHERMENTPFTEQYQPGEPVVQQYPEGFVLTIECELIPEGRLGATFHMGAPGVPRDMLFLVPDPSLYIGKVE
jgi:hypothetical protein